MSKIEIKIEIEGKLEKRQIKKVNMKISSDEEKMAKELERRKDLITKITRCHLLGATGQLDDNVEVNVEIE